MVNKITIKDVYTIENYLNQLSIIIILIKLYYLKILKIVNDISEDLWKTYKSKFVGISFEYKITTMILH